MNYASDATKDMAVVLVTFVRILIQATLKSLPGLFSAHSQNHFFTFTESIRQDDYTNMWVDLSISVDIHRSYDQYAVWMLNRIH